MLELKALTKRFGRLLVADHLSLSIAAGEIVALLGPSGCGKSTLLKMIAGLSSLDGGAVVSNNVDISHWPPEKRQISMMFQDYALFPHLTVLENVCFGLYARQIKRQEAHQRAGVLLERFGLRSRGTQAISTLSGGEAQRVALARALVIEPQLILLDEPFSNLDSHWRHTLQGECRQWLKALGLGALWVTHNHKEAFAVADRIALMHKGKIEQCALPSTLLAAPNNAWVARFIGYKNVSEQMVIPDAAFRFDRHAQPARIDKILVLAQGVQLHVSRAAESFILYLSAREAQQLGSMLTVGGSVGVEVDQQAIIRLNP